MVWLRSACLTHHIHIFDCFCDYSHKKAHSSTFPPDSICASYDEAWLCGIYLDHDPITYRFYASKNLLCDAEI